MRAMNMKKAISKTQLLLATMVAVTWLFTAMAHAAAPGITGTTFNLAAQAAFLSQPDGQFVYSWGYGCATGFTPSFAPSAISSSRGTRPVILKSIIALAHDLGMDVVAEGVETDSDAVELSQLGCEYAQGFVFGEPMTAEKARALLEPEVAITRHQETGVRTKVF